jgi:hypothetical protein
MLHAKPHTAEVVGPASMQDRHQLFPLVGSRIGSAAEGIFAGCSRDLVGSLAAASSVDARSPSVGGARPLPELLSLCFKARVLFLASTLTVLWTQQTSWDSGQNR